MFWPCLLNEPPEPFLPSEKLKLLEISSLKAKQKQTVVGVVNRKDVMAILPTILENP